MSRVTSLSRRLSTLPLLLFAALVTLTWTACSSAEVDLAIDSDFSLPVNQTLIVPANNKHNLRGRALQDAGCVVLLTVYVASYQAQEVPGQVVWTFVTSQGEAEPVSGGYRVWVRGETFSRNLRVNICGDFVAVKARLTRSTLRLNLGGVAVSTGRFADSDRYLSVRGKDFTIHNTDDTVIPLELQSRPGSDQRGEGPQGRI
ncbi:hypothetical protein NSK_005852 [Nannochloropsis salina CCMP1776]|uniref:Uncharacterized protein n=1 Tax=Nannochloropsis salina CCMP1776 TaxID=1027361 RepID=A0A4D9CZQ3_9STRA|nr:hypothetical protein NSK_005852 [Nannochloropsis salina CCMP1776]|eukprot:TFJ82845.1 hypothetical protein NSK_005852 [Nannochloropsis salina CCMP1776]